METSALFSTGARALARFNSRNAGPQTISNPHSVHRLKRRERRAPAVAAGFLPLRRFGISVAACLLLLASLATGCASTNVVEYDFNAMLQPVPLSAKWADTNYNIWCGSAVKGDDGKYHLFYSRWPRKLGHLAWVTHSEVAHAVSASPFGPWTHHDMALPLRGTNFWDGSCTHNPTILRIGKKFYLYYMGNYGDGVVGQQFIYSHKEKNKFSVFFFIHICQQQNRFPSHCSPMIKC